MVQTDPQLIQECEFVPSLDVFSSLFGDGNARVSSFWGVGPVAPIHFGYDNLIQQQRRLIEIGCDHVVLLADYHVMMTHGLSFPQAFERSLYYEHYLKECCGLKARYIRGSDFQTQGEYIERLFSLISSTKVSSIKDTFSSTVRQNVKLDAAKVSTYLYAIMQCLDASYLGSDVVFAEPGQKKIYNLISSFERKMGKNNWEFTRIPSLSQRHKRSCDNSVFVYAPSTHDVDGKRLSQSSAATRISIHETRDSLENKVRKMFAPPPGQPTPEGRVNGLLEYFRFSVFPWQTQPVDVQGIGGRLLSFESYEEFESAYNNEEILPAECKRCMVEALWRRLTAIQESFSHALNAWVDMEKSN